MQHTNRLIEWTCCGIDLLAMELGQQFSAELELFIRPIILHGFVFAMFLWRVGVSQVLWRWWVNFTLWTANRLRGRPSDNGH